MPILDDWDLQFSLEDVIRAQGADPDIVHSRKPSLVESTERAISIGHPLLHPRVLYEKYLVKRLIHHKLELYTNKSLSGKASLSGRLIGQHLGRSEKVVVMICTIGKELDEMVSSLFRTDPIIALALDSVGSVAVEQLSLQVSNYFEILAHKEGLHTSMPVNPGMIGWPLEEGQLQLFLLLDSEEIDVSLTESYMMIPNKSLSMVLGIGKDVSSHGSSCDYCNLKKVCRYQDHYAIKA